MDINRNNYEHFLLDYLEGRLNPVQREIVERFLKFNPDLAAELKDLENNQLVPQKIEFTGKELLKKHIPGTNDSFSPENFEMYAIAFLEGDLTTGQKSDFNNYLSAHPKMADQLELFRKSHLEPGKVTYPYKNKLKKRDKKRVFVNYMLPLAAAAAILLTIYINIPESAQPVEVAVTETPKKPEIEVESNIQERVPDLIQNASTIKVIKNKQAPVPVSSYKEQVSNDGKADQEKETDQKETNGESRRIAGIKPNPSVSSELPVKYDKIQLEAVHPPEVNLASLSFEDIARNQLGRVSYALQNEDDLLVNIATSGLKEINRITGTQAELLASRDEEGDLTGVHFKSRFLQFSAPISGQE